MLWLLQIVIFFTVTSTSWAQQIMNPPDLPYASNPPRIDPPYCVGMFSFYCCQQDANDDNDRLQDHLSLQVQ